MSDCVHHWRIDTPNGRYSPGFCRKCGTERVFDNVGDDNIFEAPVGQAALGQRWRLMHGLKAQ